MAIKKKAKKKFRLLPFLENAKKIIITGISIIILFLVLIYLVKTTLDRRISIVFTNIPNSLKNLGYSIQTVSQIYFDEIQNISSEAKSIYTRQEYTIKENEIDINIPFFDKEISIGEAKSILQRIFGLKPNIITGEILLYGSDSIVFTTRYNAYQPVVVKGQLREFENIVKQSAEGLFQFFDPYILASYYESKNLDIKSVETLKYAISKPPKDDDKWSYNLWGALLMKYKWYEEANQKLRISLSIDSSFFLPYYNMGIIAFNDSNYTDALKYYNKSLLLSKNKFDRAYIGIANIYLKNNKYEIAEKNIDEAIRLNPQNGFAYLTKAQIKLAQNDTSKSIELLDKAIVIDINDINDADYYSKLGAIKFLQKDYKGAEQLYSKAYKLDSLNFRIVTSYRLILILNGDLEKANYLEKNVIDKLFLVEILTPTVNGMIKQQLIH